MDYVKGGTTMRMKCLSLVALYFLAFLLSGVSDVITTNTLAADETDLEVERT